MTDANGTPNAPVLVWLEIRGFRSFGTEARRLDLDAPLTVVHGRNSQGKSSLAEALEFLLTGRSSRRDLLGGAKAEYHESLRNVHLPAEDQDVWVAAGLRGEDGQVHEVRRELMCDFAQGVECETRLLVDGVEQADLAAFALGPAAGSPLGAPVLLQHTLRHVLSTQPKERVGYFKSLLSLTDLDTLRDRISQARRRLTSQPPTRAAQVFTALSRTPFSSVSDLLSLTPPPRSKEAATQLVNEALLNAAAQVLGQQPADLASLTNSLQATVERRRESLFPLSAFTNSPTPTDLAPIDLTGYATALARADRDAAALAPIFTAVLAVPTITEVAHPVDCPVCATPSALTPDRLAALRDELRRGADVEVAAQHAANALRAASSSADRTWQQALAAIPAAGNWTAEQVRLARQQVADLGLDERLLTTAGSSAARVKAAATSVGTAVQGLQTALRTDLENVSRRADVDESARATALQQLTDALTDLRRARQDSDDAAAVLRAAVEPVVSTRTASTGLAELLEAAQDAEALAVELHHAGVRAETDARLDNAEKALGAATAKVLDSRFEQMSESISRWWLTIRPEELVAFAGVQRRAGGATFVNLMASLRTAPEADPIKRHALGVFSDSQLNALGLSTFLARTELLQTPLVVLDDPIPGSDADHRFTFAQNTVDNLVRSGTQVVLTTYDSKLAQLAAGQQAGRSRRTFELNLMDHVAGTEPTLTSDVFDQLMLEAEDNVNAPTAHGRRAACTNYRIAAERLAKQIIATGRSHTGAPTTVADVENEAKMLGRLVPLVKGFATSDTEKGQWTNFATVLNPGNHDDEVPSNADLRQIRTNLKKIAKDHKRRYPGGLVQ